MIDPNDPNNPYNQPPGGIPFSPEETPKSRGCLFYGCITAVVLAVLMLIVVGLGLLVLYSKYTQAINDYTGTAPVPLPKVEMAPEEQKSLDERVKAFRESLDKGEADELVLNGDELNTLISENPNVKDKIYLTLKGDKVSGQVSFPLEQIGLPGLKGRFLNGSATLKAYVHDGRLVVLVQDLEVNGKSLPPQFKQQIANQNWAEEFNKDPKQAELLSKFESVEVKDGKVYIRSRKAGSRPDSVPAPETKSDDAPAPEKKPDDAPAPEPKGAGDPGKTDEGGAGALKAA